MRLDSGAYSTEDVAMPGRAAFYPDAEIPLKNKLTIVMSEMSQTVYNKIVSGQIVQYSCNRTNDCRISMEHC